MARLCLPLTVFLFRYSATQPLLAQYLLQGIANVREGKNSLFSKIQNQIEMVYLFVNDATVLRLGEIILAAKSITKACNVASELCEEPANERTQNDRSSAMRTNY